MSANVESMFYTGREKPWHGLGIQVESAPLSEDALRLAELDWNVIQHDVIVDGKIVPNYKANVRDKDDTVLGIVTDRYKIVQNKDAFSFTDNLIGDGVRYETAGSLAGGKRIWLLAKMPDTTILGDKVEPYLVFSNSHDGTGAIKVAMTPVRVVCQNTLNLALDGATRIWTAKHVGDIEGKLDEAKRTLELATTYMTQFESEAEKLASVKISDEDLSAFLDSLFPIPDRADVSDRKIINIQTVRRNFKNAYEMPDLADFKGTAYGIVNAMSDMVTHAEPLRKSVNYNENLFEDVIDGHKIIDLSYAWVKNFMKSRKVA